MSAIRQSDSEATVGLHFRRYPEVDANIYDNALLVEALGSLGMSSVLIPNARAYDLSLGTVRALPLELDKTSEFPYITPGDMLTEYNLGPEGVNAIRARVGIAKRVENLAAVINDTETRALGIDKWQQYQLAGDFMPITHKLELGSAITIEHLETIPGDKIVIKKSGGSESRWLEICSKNISEAGQAVKNMRTRIDAKLIENPEFQQDLIIQEFVAAQKIEGVKPINEAETDRYKNLGSNGHELRYYCFAKGGPNTPLDFYVALRAFDEGKGDEWIFIDQDRLPSGATLLAERISDRFMDKTGSNGAFIAIDLFRGQRSSDDQPRWLVREINAKDPIMASSNRSPIAAREQRTKLGRLLADLASPDKRGNTI